MMSLKILFLLILSIPSFVRASSKMVETLNNILKNESMKLWPGHLSGGRPVEVKLGLSVVMFDEVDWMSGNFEIVGYLRLGWTDPRISFSKDVGTLKTTLNNIADKLWVPDVFVRNSKSVVQHTTLVADSAVRINPLGKIWMIVKLTLVVNCPQKLHRFPFDTQRCSVFVENFLHRLDEVELAWMSPGIDLLKETELRDYALIDKTLGSSIQNYSTGAFQDLSVTFELRRLYGHYVVYWFIPTVLTTVLMYLLLWLPDPALTAKSVLGTGLFLVFIVLMIGGRMDSPRVTYMTAIDKWFTVHVFFLFFSVLDVICLHLLQGGKTEEGGKATPRERSLRERVVRGILWLARVAYPVIYILFLAIYFGIYTN